MHVRIEKWGRRKHIILSQHHCTQLWSREAGLEVAPDQFTDSGCERHSLFLAPFLCSNVLQARETKTSKENLLSCQQEKKNPEPQGEEGASGRGQRNDLCP